MKKIYNTKAALSSEPQRQYDIKCLMFCLGTLKELVDGGFIKIEGLTITESGFQEYQKLKESGFDLSADEMRSWVAAVQREYSIIELIEPIATA